MPKLYNIALYPSDEECRQEFFLKAGLLGSIEDGYCLRPGKALPHVTLCQFRVLNDNAPKALVNEFVDKDISVDIMGIYLNPGKAEHAGKVWIGYSVKRTSVLIDYQAEIVRALKSSETNILTATGNDYFPHFTLARLPENHPDFDITGYLKTLLINRPVQCTVRLGLSDENGQYLSVL